MLLRGEPSISMGHLYHGYVSHNQRVIDDRTSRRRDVSVESDSGNHPRVALLLVGGSSLIQ